MLNHTIRCLFCWLGHFILRFMHLSSSFPYHTAYSNILKKCPNSAKCIWAFPRVPHVRYRWLHVPWIGKSNRWTQEKMSGNIDCQKEKFWRYLFSYIFLKYNKIINIKYPRTIMPKIVKWTSHLTLNGTWCWAICLFPGWSLQLASFFKGTFPAWRMILRFVYCFQKSGDCFISCTVSHWFAILKYTRNLDWSVFVLTLCVTYIAACYSSFYWVMRSEVMIMPLW